MPQTSTLWLFISASVLLLLMPGPSVLYVTGRTLDQGARAGLLSTLGLALGDLVQILAVVVGLSALVASSELLFNTVKYVGAAYLLWLGIRRLRTPAVPVDLSEAGEKPRQSKILSEGLMVNALNPKSVLFFLSLFPGFIKSSQGPVWSQTLVLGLVFVALGMVTNGGWAVVSLLLRERAQRSTGFLHVQRYVGGGVFLVLAGAAVAL